MGGTVDYKPENQASLISYFNFPVGKKIIKTISIDEIRERFPSVVEYQFDLKSDEEINLITNSLNRYGYFIIAGTEKKTLIVQRDEINMFLENQLVGNLI